MTTTVTNEIRQRVNDRIAQLDDLCADIFGREIAPSISYGLKGKVAGQAWLSKNSIKINAYCLMNNLDDYIKQTLGHEYAHLLVHQEHGFNVQPHGHEWKSLACRQIDVIITKQLRVARLSNINTVALSVAE